MKIVHVCLCGPYTDGMNYQENLLAKYNSKSGYEVVVVASQWIWNKDGELEKCNQNTYFDNDGIEVIRLPILIGNVNNRFKYYPVLMRTLKNEKPDVIFVHDCQFINLLTVVRYMKKNKDTQLYIDNHVDYLNGAHGFLSKYILHGIIWKIIVAHAAKYTRKFYGVLPARVDFLKERYKLPEDKCELLMMGADDEFVELALKERELQTIRKEYAIGPDTFLIATGGKINSNRPETLELMEAINKMEGVKLIVFGSVSKEYQQRFNQFVKSKKIIYVGWKDNIDTYRILGSSDLVVFPGLHSVMWEQTVALGIPMVCRKIEGFEHIDIGGNIHWIDKLDTDSIMNVLRGIVEDDVHYKNMWTNAQKDSKREFLYSEIIKKSLE